MDPAWINYRVSVTSVDSLYALPGVEAFEPATAAGGILNDHPWQERCTLSADVDASRTTPW